MFNRRRLIQASGLGAASLAVSSRPLKARTRYRWKMITTWPKNFPGLGTGAEKLAKRIQELSGGEIEIRVYGAGELAPALGVFDAVSRGSAEMGHASPYYWKAKHEAAQFFGAVPFGLTTMEMSAWLHYGGGQKLWEELYRPFGLISFAAGNTGVQMGGWFRKEISSIRDFKRLKMRMPGLGAEVLTEIGATVVTLPGGEIFQALQTGTIDATEWVGAYNDAAFGLYKAAKFYYWPGWHEPCANIECMLNLKEYEKLEPRLQKIIQIACKASYEDMVAEFVTRNAQSLKDLVKNKGVQLRKFPDEVLKQLAKTSIEVVQQVSQKDASSKRIYESYNNFRKNAISLNQKTEEAFSIARALT